MLLKNGGCSGFRVALHIPSQHGAHPYPMFDTNALVVHAKQIRAAVPISANFVNAPGYLECTTPSHLANHHLVFPAYSLADVAVEARVHIIDDLENGGCGAACQLTCRAPAAVNDRARRAPSPSG